MFRFSLSVLMILLWTLSAQSQPYLLADANAGAGHAINQNDKPVELNGILLYRADDGVHGQELWRTDGTPGGTYMVMDVNPGIQGSSIYFRQMLNNKMTFESHVNGIGTELWATDGTTAGTYILSDVWPGLQNGIISPTYQIYNNTLYFSGRDSTGNYLWQSDGTQAGTHKVNSPIVIKNYLGDNPVLNNKLIFSAGDGINSYGRLLTLDNSSGNPVITDITPPGLRFYNYGLAEYHFANNILYFQAHYLNSNDYALWRTDGTATGTRFVCQFRTGAASSFQFVGQLNQNQLLMFASTDTTAIELFSIDLNSETASLIKDTWAGTHNGVNTANGTYLFTSNNKLFFYADNGTTGDEPWVSDGTPAGTFLLKDFWPGINSSIAGVNRFREFNNRVLFVSDLGNNDLCSSDGTVNGTEQLTALGDWSDYLFEKNNLYFFRYYNYAGPPFTDDVYYTDGTAAGTVCLNIYPGNLTSVYAWYLGEDNGNYFLWVSDSVHGSEIWKSDGTPGNFSLFTELVPGTNGCEPQLASNEGISFFYQNDMYLKIDTMQTGANEEIWKINETTGVASQVSNFDGDQITIGQFNFINNRYVVFPVRTDSLGTEMWAFDMPGIGTSVKNVTAKNYSIYPVPSGTTINVGFNNSVQGRISLYNLYGQIISSIDFSGTKANINLEEFSDGIYLIKFESKTESWSEKVIIQH